MITWSELANTSAETLTPEQIASEVDETSEGTELDVSEESLVEQRAGRRVRAAAARPPGIRTGALRKMTPLIEVKDLVKHFPIKKGLIFQRQIGAVKAVDGVSFDVERGETLGIVGETGCGKSTTARLLCRLMDPTSGTITFDGREVGAQKGDDLKALHRDMQMVFQDPYSSLNPRKSVGSIIADPFVIHGLFKGAGERKRRVQDLMERVGLNPEHYNRYPHEFSGGQRQRIGVARAIALEPKLLVADEPVSALDVSIQAQVLNLLRELQRDMGLTLIFIAHDLSVVRHMCDRVAVMYLGRIVEMAPATCCTRRRATRTPARCSRRCPFPIQPAASGAPAADRRRAQPGQPAVGVPVPHPLPQGPGEVLRGRAAARAQGRAGRSRPATTRSPTRRSPRGCRWRWRDAAASPSTPPRRAGPAGG